MTRDEILEKVKSAMCPSKYPSNFKIDEGLLEVIASYIGDMEEFESFPSLVEIEKMYDLLLYYDVTKKFPNVKGKLRGLLK